MRPFIIQRTEDPTGVSGTGQVAEGVQFADGYVALRWMTIHRSVSVWNSINDVVSVHCHHGMSKIVWLD